MIFSVFHVELGLLTFISILYPGFVYGELVIDSFLVINGFSLLPSNSSNISRINYGQAHRLSA